jgi:hypothetical protein
MQTLFESHPKLKNSLNTMTKSQRQKVDYSTWDINPDGFVHSVETVMPEYDFEDKLLWADSEKIKTDIENGGMLPLAVQDWLNDNVTGLWMYETRLNMDKKDKMYFRKIMFLFHFEKEKDAAVFRLTWQK